MGMWRRWPIGFHIGPGGNARGITDDFLAPLDAAGILWCLKSIGVYPKDAVDIANAGGKPHTIIWRPVGLDIPNYDLEPAEAASQHWASVLAVLPPELDKELVWIEAINEVDKNRADWLGYFGVEWTKLAWAAGYQRVLMFGWSSGEPEPEHWYLPGMVEFLTLASQNRDRLAIALHEYSYDVNDIWRMYPYLIGRFNALNLACDQLDIPRVTIAFTEWGWEHETVPSVGQALFDIHDVAREYALHPNLIGAGLWYLGYGYNNIADLAQPLIKPVADLALGWEHYVHHPWPPEDGPVEPPVENENIFRNGSFENGNYKWEGVDELNIPNEWDFGYADETVENPIDSNPWSNFVRPEAVNPSKAFIPEEEHETLFLHGDYVEKIFKGHSSINFSLTQRLILQPGTYMLVMPVFADLVKGYTDAGEKIWADDPDGNDGLARILWGPSTTEWMSLTPGKYNAVTHVTKVDVGRELEIGIEIMLPYALVQNGVFLDAFSLEKWVEPEPPVEPPTGDCIATDQYTKYHILRPETLHEAQWDYIINAMELGVELPGLGTIKIGYEGWSHLDAMGAIRQAIEAGFTDSRLVIVDGYAIAIQLPVTYSVYGMAG